MGGRPYGTLSTQSGNSPTYLVSMSVANTRSCRFYVNLHTKATQWEKPTAPAIDPSTSGAPPAYSPPPTGGHLYPEKGNPNNPYSQLQRPQTPNDIDADARYAAQLQAEENARAAGHQPNRGASSSFYNDTNAHNQGGYGGPIIPQQQPPEQKRGFLDKLTGRNQHYQGNYPAGQGPSPGSYNQGPPPPGYGGYPPPQQGYFGGGPPQGYGYGQPQYAPQPQYVQQQSPPKKSGMGAGTGALLGAGGGLIGGALLMDAFENHEQFEEEQAYQQGYDQGNDNNGGGDMGGGDMGGVSDFLE